MTHHTKSSACLIGLLLLATSCSANQPLAAPVANATRPVARATPLPTREVVTSTSISADGALTMTTPVLSLGFDISAKVTTVNVTLAQRVKKGDLLATVDDTTLQDAVADAQLALKLVQANIALQNVPATKEDIAAAQAALNSAYASYGVTKAGNLPTAIESARMAVDSAWKGYLASQVSRDYACGSIRGLAAPSCKSAEASYGNTFESWLSARDSYQKLIEPVPQNTLTQAWASVVAAQTKLAALQNGVTPQQAKIDAAQVAQSTAALELAKSNLSQARLLSPCNCTIQGMNVMTGVLPSSTAFTLVDLASVQFQTANLVENDIAKIKIGAPVTLRLKSYPDVFTGKVSAVLAQSSGSQNGAALYTVLISLDPTAKNLLPGMTGQAEIATQAE